MTPALAGAMRQQWSHFRDAMAGLGALESLTFKGVGPGGADIYIVKFEKGTLEYRIWLSPDGKIDNTNYRTP